MTQDRLYRLFEKQRRRQIAAVLAVCSPEEKERILAEEQNRGQLPVSLRHVTLNASEESHGGIESSGILRSDQNDNPQSQPQSIQKYDKESRI